MSTTTFTTKLHGKWILAGEHAVLRYSPAIIFPVKSRQFNLSYMPDENNLTINCGGNFIGAPNDVVLKVIQQACALLDLSNLPTGKLVLMNDVPMSAGMGASAILCIAITQWFAALGLLSTNKIFNFACQLENMFHGESSGADIAVILENQGIIYQRQAPYQILNLNWQPRWVLSHCGQNGLTADCMQKVKKFISQNPIAGKTIDLMMQESVELATKALSTEESKGLPQLV